MGRLCPQLCFPRGGICSQLLLLLWSGCARPASSRGKKRGLTEWFTGELGSLRGQSLVPLLFSSPVCVGFRQSRPLGRKAAGQDGETGSMNKQFGLRMMEGPGHSTDAADAQLCGRSLQAQLSLLAAASITDLPGDPCLYLSWGLQEKQRPIWPAWNSCSSSG